jgi:hypothetical protein
MAPAWGIAVGDENPPKIFLCASINEILHGHITDKLVKPLWIKNQPQWLLNLAQ